MTDSTHSSSARFASFLDRDSCAWMPSPSVALLAALITGKGRPRRLLVPENAPPFISNIGLILGATTVTISPQDIDDALKSVFRSDSLSPEQVWAVVVHRDGKLSPADWLARCMSHGVPTVELCLGSLFALAQWSPFPATFTIVDLEAEEAFAGARLAALLTGDRNLGARVRELCLPAPGARDYIFDAVPRGLAYDEAVLAKLVDQVIALDGEKAPATRSFEWSFRLAEAAREAAQQALTSSSERDSLALEESRKKVGELQKTIDNWERLFEESEAEAAKDAEILTRARTEQQRLKAESEKALAAAQAETEALNQRLVRAERERDLAVQDAGRRDQAERGLLHELKDRVVQFEKAAAEAASREAAQAASWKTARLGLGGRIAKLEGAAEAAEIARAEMLKEKAQLEQALTAVRAEKAILAAKLASLDAELGDALKDAAKEAAAQRAALDEEGQRAIRLEKDIATLTSREATRLREWSEARAGLSSRITAAEAERDALIAKVAVFERDRERMTAEAARLDEARRAETAELRHRAGAFEAEVAALRKREEGLAAELKASRAGLSEEARKLQAEAVRSQQAAAAHQAQSAASEQALSLARAEVKAALEKVAEVEKEREALRRASSEQQQRADRFEKEAAALGAKVAGQAGDLSRLEAERAKAEAERATARAQMEAVEAARASLQSEKETLGTKLAEIEKDRDRWRQAAHETKTAAVSSADEDARTRAWDVERASMLEKITALEAAAAQARAAHATQLASITADAARAMSASRNEGEVVAQALLLAEKERDEQKRRVDHLEKEGAAHIERLAQSAREWELSRAGLAERIVALETAAAASEKAHADHVASQARDAAARDALRAEREALGARLGAMEKDHALALSEAARREDALRQAADAEKRRAAQLAGEAAALVEREAATKREWEDARAEWTERLRRAEDAALIARNANASLVTRKNEAEQARASLQAELEEQMRLAQQFKMEAAAVAAREAKKVEAAEAGRAGMEARLAKLEAAAAIADKARTELLNRKRDSDRALAEAQAERTALLKKLAVAENERDEALARASGPQASREGRPAPAGPPPAEGERNTGGLSALVNLWNTAIIRRPAPSKADLEPDLEAILVEAPPSNPIPPLSQMPPPVAPEAAAPPAPVPKKQTSAPGDSPTGASRRTTGGLSALVSLWNTAATMRPFRRKEDEAKPGVPANEPVLGMEVIEDHPPLSNEPLPVHSAPAPPKAPASSPRPRPTTTPRRPEPKAAPVSDESEKLGGWLRGLAGKVRGKSK